MKKIAGAILIVIGLVILFSMTGIYSFGFYSFGRVSTAGILIVLLVITGVFLFVRQDRLSLILFLVVIGLLVLSLILGTSIYFKHQTLLDLLLTLVPIIAGISLVVLGIIEDKHNR